MKNTIYISDMDWTLLGNDATLSEYSFNRLSHLIRSGLNFTVASARSVVSIRQMLKGLELRLPVIEFNGAFVTDLYSNEKLVMNDLKKSAIDESYQLIKDFGSSPFISTFDGTEDRVYYDRVQNDGMLWYVEDRLSNGDPRFQQVEDVTEHLQEHVVCMTTIGYESEVNAIRSRVEEAIPNGIEMQLFENSYNPGWHWLTIHDGRASKCQAIEQLVGGIDLQDLETVVFGDQMNDLSMFKAADRCYAVANAVDELKNHATAVIGTNEEDSVVKFIEEDYGLSSGIST